MIERHRIANRRPNERLAFEYKGRPGYIIAGYPVDISGGLAVVADKPGEFFIIYDRVGSDIEAAARDFGLMLSIAMQHGVDARAFALSMTRGEDGKPASVLGAALAAIVDAYYPKGEP